MKGRGRTGWNRAAARLGWLLVVAGVCAPTMGWAEEPPPSNPFTQGTWRFGGSGGYVQYGSDSYFAIGASVGYFVVNGFEFGVDAETFLGADPNITRLSPRASLVLWQVPVVHPYVGGFYARQFIGGGIDDVSSLGARGGVTIEAGSRGFATAGVRYERVMGECVGDGCELWIPEIGFTFAF